MNHTPIRRKAAPGNPLSTFGPRTTGMPPRPAPVLSPGFVAKNLPIEREPGRMREPQAERRVRTAPARKRTGFDRHVRLSVRKRAGNGDASEARCEAHGGFLGLHDGDYQHVVARGMGGNPDPIANSAANCALLCRRCHDLCEARDPEMEAAGFWQRQGTDPRMAPMMLASEHGSGVLVWRSVDGRYLFEQPGEVAA